jgi:uncharacterized Rossmann fold enzyme
MEALRKIDYRETEASLPPPPDARENILASLTRGLPEFQPALLPHDGTIVVCGSGPSLPSFIEDIRAEREKRRPIFAVKGAHDLLVKNGIEPNAFVSCEAKPRLNNVQLKNKNTLYLLSARCSPELYDWLSDCNVMTFHTYAEKEATLPELSGKPLIGGGTTSGLRAVTLGYLFGFARFVMYGFDSCLALRSSQALRLGAMKPWQIRDRWVRGRRFLCNAAMAMQADECQEYMKLFPDLSMDFKGDGLLSAIWAERKRLGLRT